MRFLTLLLITTLFSGLALARMEGGVERTRVGAYYGYGLLSPNDINNFETALGGTPALNKLSNFFYYGAQLGYKITPRVELIGEYTQEYAKNPVTSTLGTNAGVELSLNAFFAGIAYYLKDNGPIRFHVAAEVGYPTYAHASFIVNGRKEYDSTFAPIGKAMATVDFFISNRFSIFVDGGYEYDMLNALSNGTNLKNGTSNVNFDMSGVRAQAGLNFMF